MNKYINKANAKVIGNAGLRVGKDIIREGTKAVAFKTVSGVVVGLATEGVKGVKDITLDDILGDLSRQELKVEKNQEKMIKKEIKLQRKHEKATMSPEDLEVLDAKRKDLSEQFDRAEAMVYATEGSEEAKKKASDIWDKMEEEGMIQDITSPKQKRKNAKMKKGETKLSKRNREIHEKDLKEEKSKE